MKKSLKTVTLATILALTLVLSSISVFAAETTLTVTSPSGDTGTNVVVSVNVSANSGMAATGFELTWDITKLEYVAGSAVKGNAIDGNTSADVFPSAGKITAGYTNNTDNGFIGSGSMLDVTFKILETAPGPIPLTLTVVEFVNSGFEEIPLTVTQGAVTVNAPLTSSVTLTKSNTPDMFDVSIAGCNPNYSYQIWAYQTMTSDIFNGTGTTYTANNWKLVLNYTAGSLFAFTGSTGKKEIPEFDPIDGNYTISVRVKDVSDNFVEQLKDTFTDAQVGVAKITKILVDGKISFDSKVVREIKSGASVEFDVIANMATTYSATTTPSSVLVPDGSKFVWDISDLEPGAYSVNLGAGADKKVVSVELYKAGAASTYGQISDVTFGNKTSAGLYWNYAFTPAFDVYADKKFRYSIGEAMRSPIYTSDLITASNATLAVSDAHIKQTGYGVYQLVSMIGKANGTVEDGIVKTIVNKRSEADSTLSVITEGFLTKATPVTITATATIPDVSSLDIEYSFWRRDAKGWVMVRDYASGNILGWTPSRIGDYTIQVRAKGPGAESYEVAKNVDISITGGLKGSGSVASINISTATARTPIEITPTITSDDTDLMYKYIISNSFLYHVETNYSVDPSYLWVPGKAGSYKVQVLVKNSESFGKYDFAKSFDIIVNNPLT